MVTITHADFTYSKQNALRRAANALERDGLVKITSMDVNGIDRLVACPPDSAVSPPRLVTGLDGKTYRLAP